jgi:hypothetical protein
VMEIRRLFAEGATGPALARRFGVSKESLYAIKHGRNWRHL